MGGQGNQPLLDLLTLRDQFGEALDIAVIQHPLLRVDELHETLGELAPGSAGRNRAHRATAILDQSGENRVSLG